MTPTQKRMDAGMWWDKGPMVVKGCTVVSPGCANCWAAGLDHRFGFGNTTGKGKWNGRVQTDIGALEKAVRGKPKVITIWNDLFHEDVPDEFIGRVGRITVEHPDHLFLVLTKRSKRMQRYFSAMRRRLAINPPWEDLNMPNVWLGTSVESQDHVDRLEWLLRTPATKRFVSIEPTLGEIDLRPYLSQAPGPCLQWVIVGAESGPKRRPCDIEWVRKIVQDCKKAGVPVWVKQLHDKNGKVVHQLDQFPEDLRFREWPE